MPSLLLSTKYNKWICTKPDWLSKDEIPADPIFGLQTKSNTMSVWVVDNDRGRIEQIVGALAATRDTLQDFEYVLLDSKAVTDIGIKIQQTEGTSIDKKLNKLHFDLIEISAQKLVKIAETILKKIWQKDISHVKRIPRKTIASYIVDRISEGRIDMKLVTPKVLSRVQEVLGHLDSKKS